jgi:hypothetical protein
MYLSAASIYTANKVKQYLENSYLFEYFIPYHLVVFPARKKSLVDQFFYRMAQFPLSIYDTCSSRSRQDNDRISQDRITNEDISAATSCSLTFST